MIVHSDIPLRDNPPECRAYLEILQMALADWSERAKPDAAEAPPEWSYVEHDFRVVFPIEARAALENKARGSKSQERDVFHAPQKAQGRAGSRRVQALSASVGNLQGIPNRP
jgi:hypothetical protein